MFKSHAFLTSHVRGKSHDHKRITCRSRGGHIFQDFSVIDRFYFYCKLSGKHVELKKEFKGKIPNQYLRIAHWGTQIAYISSTNQRPSSRK